MPTKLKLMASGVVMIMGIAILGRFESKQCQGGTSQYNANLSWPNAVAIVISGVVTYGILSFTKTYD